LDENAGRVEKFTHEYNTWSVPQEAGQRELHAEYGQLLVDDPDSLSRVREAGHFTASALLVDPRRSEVLLVMHPRVKRWLQMGGHIELADGGFHAAAMRECIEESGYSNIEVVPVPLRFDRHNVPCKSASGEVVQSVHWDVQFLALVDSDQPRHMTEDAKTTWWDMNEGLPDIDQSVVNLINAARVHIATKDQVALEFP